MQGGLLSAGTASLLSETAVLLLLGNGPNRLRSYGLSAFTANLLQKINLILTSALQSRNYIRIFVGLSAVGAGNSGGYLFHIRAYQL